MPRHDQKDVSFDVPRHWEDKTLVAFAAPARPGQRSTASLVMTRDALLDREDLREYGDRQLAELAQKLDGFELVKKEDTTLGGFKAIVLRFMAKASSGPIVQRLVVVEGRRRAVFCFTATTAKTDFEQNDPLFDRILSSVRFAQSEDT
jgi:hypothetical protein